LLPDSRSCISPCDVEELARSAEGGKDQVKTETRKAPRVPHAFYRLHIQRSQDGTTAMYLLSCCTGWVSDVMAVFTMVWLGQRCQLDDERVGRGRQMVNKDSVASRGQIF
jgi:hypothetical protein